MPFEVEWAYISDRTFEGVTHRSVPTIVWDRKTAVGGRAARIGAPTTDARSNGMFGT